MGPAVKIVSPQVSSKLERHAKVCRDNGVVSAGSAPFKMAGLVSLRDHDFRGLDLKGGDFSYLDFRGCDFSKSRLSCIHFDWSDLRGAKFTDTWLDGVSWQFADLRGADMIGAWMFGGRVVELVPHTSVRVVLRPDLR